jgi:hypothetical protein
MYRNRFNFITRDEILFFIMLQNYKLEKANKFLFDTLYLELKYMGFCFLKYITKHIWRYSHHQIIFFNVFGWQIDSSAERLSSKREALSSNPNILKRKNCIMGLVVYISGRLSTWG